MNEKDFHFRPDTNRTVLLSIMHTSHGNMLSRCTNFLTEDGEKEWRQRDDEFEIQTIQNKQLMKSWEKGWKCYLDTLGILKEDDLMKTIYIRKEPFQ